MPAVPTLTLCLGGAQQLCFPSKAGVPLHCWVTGKGACFKRQTVGVIINELELC